MAIECEVIVPEVDVKFPAVMENSVGCRMLVINDDIAIPDDGPVVTNFRQMPELYHPCPPGSKFVMKITAEDGREWPRIHTQSTKAIWVLLDEVRKFPVIDEHGESMNRTFVVDWASGGKNLPAGTITTITFCDGEWTCEIQEPPKDWLPMEIVGLRVSRAGNYLDFHGILLSGVTARQLSEVAARFADEQEFPGESLPINYRDAYGEKWSYEICGNGDLELGSSVVSSVDECDRAIRVIRLYKRHLEA